jgi:hypothetical protein
VVAAELRHWQERGGRRAARVDEREHEPSAHAEEEQLMVHTQQHTHTTRQELHIIAHSVRPLHNGRALGEPGGVHVGASANDSHQHREHYERPALSPQQGRGLRGE